MAWLTSHLTVDLAVALELYVVLAVAVPAGLRRLGDFVARKLRPVCGCGRPACSDRSDAGGL